MLKEAHLDLRGIITDGHHMHKCTLHCRWVKTINNYAVSNLCPPIKCT